MIKNYKEAKAVLMSSDEIDTLGYFGMMSTELMLKIASGEIDAVALAKAHLACRGMGEAGEWIGFKPADELWSKK